MPIDPKMTNDKRQAGQKRPMAKIHATLLAAALLAAFPVRADDRLLDILRGKAILTEDEYRGLKAAGASTQVASKQVEEGLLGVLKAKGILTEQEYLALKPPDNADKPDKAGKPDEAGKPDKADKPDRKELAVVFKDGVTFQDESRDFSFALTGRIQADARSFDRASPNTNTDTFEVRRARLGMEATFYQDYEAEVTADFSATAKLDTAYVNAAWWDAAQLRMGLFKMPFSLEELTSSKYIDFQERSLANAQALGKQRGIMLHGAPAKGVYYGVALSNGNGGSDRDDNDSKDLIGRLALNFAEISGYRDTVLHLGAAFSDGRQPMGDVVPNGRSEGRGITFFNPTAFTGSSTEVRRSGLETALAKGSVKFQAEAITTGYSGASAAGVGYDRDLSAWYASLNWLMTGESYADAYKRGVFGRIRPHSNFTKRGGKGAVELGLRYSRLDAADFTAANPAGTGVLGAGMVNEADAWSLGAKWIVNPNTRFLANYVHTRFGSPVTVSGATVNKENAFTLRSQMDF